MSTSFAIDIRPLFRPNDINCMKPHGVHLDSYEYMSDPAGNSAHADHGNARDVLDRVDGMVLPRMPMGGPAWNNDQVAIFRRWIDEGCQS